MYNDGKRRTYIGRFLLILLVNGSSGTVIDMSFYRYYPLDVSKLKDPSIVTGKRGLFFASC